MANKVKITNQSGEQVFPITHVSAVLDDNGNSVGQSLGVLHDLYEALTQSNIVVVASEDWPLAELEERTIYRVAGTTSYTDYMFDGTEPVPMATYDNAIDDVPTAGSDNLVKSGGVHQTIFGSNVDLDVTPTTQQGYMYSNSGTSITITANASTYYSGTVVSTSQSPTDGLDISQYRGFVLRVVTSGSTNTSMRMTIIADSDNKVLATVKEMNYTQGSDYYYTEITIPSTAKWFFYSGLRTLVSAKILAYSRVSGITDTIGSIQEDILDLESADESINLELLKKQDNDKTSLFPLYKYENPLKSDNTLSTSYNAAWKTYYKVAAHKGDVFTYKGAYTGSLTSGYSYYIITDTEDNVLSRKDADGVAQIFDYTYTMPSDGFISVCFAPAYDFVCLTSKESRIAENIYQCKSLFYNSFFSAFYKFGVIGDSLSVGYTTNPVTSEILQRNLKFSWGQILARKNGQVCLNFGFAGATSSTWFTNETYECANKVSQAENLCQAYIIGMGANLDAGGLGSISDVDWNNRNNNAATFYGQYARIIQLLNAVAPSSLIFCLTLPYPRENAYRNAAIKEICSNANVSNVYVVDLTQYNNFIKDYIAGESLGGGEYGKFYYSSHFTAAGYAMCAELIERGVGKVIFDNPDDAMQSIGHIPFGSNDIIL